MMMFQQGHLGSTVKMANSSGNATDTNGYTSFGSPTNSSFPTRYQFTGREFDSFSGLQYSRARFYDPQIGRFISEDPIGFRGGDVNLYGYVKNNPIYKRDPFGLEECTWPFTYYCDYRRKADEKEFDDQLVHNTNIAISNQACFRKNPGSYLSFYRIGDLARFNQWVSTTASGAQAASVYDTAGSPFTKEPYDLFDTTEDGYEGALEVSNSLMRKRNLREIEDLFNRIGKMNRPENKCSCQVNNPYSF